MDGRLAAALAVLVVTVSAVAAVPVGGTPPEGEGGCGATISAFMQSSAAETAGSVENRMWMATFNRSEADRRAQLVRSRSRALEQRVERLQAERAELLNESDGDVTSRERAKAARLAARIETLNEAINHTEHAATVAGVDAAKLDQLRTQARNLGGPQVAAMARGLAGQNRTNDAGSSGDKPGKSDNYRSGSATDTDDANAQADRGKENADQRNASRSGESHRA